MDKKFPPEMFAVFSHELDGGEVSDELTTMDDVAFVTPDIGKEIFAAVYKLDRVVILKHSIEITEVKDEQAE